ncbi:hypothetical protein BV20DRAFT_971656 [Pilatotrama ljubarskyi]|nr:hypothetical protein BV20DRAFT_971656 [Pilatotrama ljubarskyi]
MLIPPDYPSDRILSNGMEPLQDHEPSTSASTIRGLRHLDMGLLSEPSSIHYDDQPEVSPYHPSSPHSAFHSEPGSPSGDSISSFPSVSSSFLFSSGPASPPHPHPHSEPESELGDSTSGLVIPSLMLPSPSRKPTACGQTLGELRLLFLGPKGADMSVLASQLVEDNEDVVEVGLWEEASRESASAQGKKATLRASTSWVEHRDAHGLERIEPARNVELVELPSYDPYAPVDSVVERVLPVIQSPFHQVMDILNREHPPSGTIAHLLSSSSSPLNTALILLASPSPTSAEKALIEALSPHIPIVLLFATSASPQFNEAQSNISYRITSPHLSTFRPSSVDALRIGLFRTPSTLAALRAEAVARFLRWREVERAVERVHSDASVRATLRSSAMKTPMASHPLTDVAFEEKRGWWDRQVWEAQWEGELSQEVAVHLRRRRRAGTARRMAPLSALPPVSEHGMPERQTSYFHGVGSSPDASKSVLDTPMPRDADQGGLHSPPCPPSTLFDPLHIPSLVVFSFSLLGALRTRFLRSLGFTQDTRRSASLGRKDQKRKREEGVRGFGYTFGVGLAIVSAFCAGVGFGLLAARF